MLKHIKEYNEYSTNDDIINEGLGDVWDRFKKAVGDFFSRKKTIVIKKPGVKVMDPKLITGEHMIYLTHQQGPSGLANIMNILRGESKIESGSRNKLLNNMPQSDPRYTKVKIGKSKPKHGLGRHHAKTAAGHGRVALLLIAPNSGGITDTQVITSHDISSTYMFIGNCIEQMQSSDFFIVFKKI